MLLYYAEKTARSKKKKEEKGSQSDVPVGSHWCTVCEVKQNCGCGERHVPLAQRNPVPLVHPVTSMQ